MAAPLFRPNRSIHRGRDSIHVRYGFLILILCGILWYQQEKTNASCNSSEISKSAYEKESTEFAETADQNTDTENSETMRENLGTSDEKKTTDSASEIVPSVEYEEEPFGNEENYIESKKLIDTMLRISKLMSEARRHTRYGQALKRLADAQNLIYNTLNTFSVNEDGLLKTKQDESAEVEFSCGGIDTCRTEAVAINMHVVILSDTSKEVDGAIFKLKEIYPSVNVSILPLPCSNSSQQWKSFFSSIDQKYTLLLPNFFIVDESTNLYRLLKLTNLLNSNVHALGTAYRHRNGHWFDGCHQLSLENYTLKFRLGYERSKRVCIFCDYIAGPFLTTTQNLIDYVDSAEIHETLLVQYFIEQMKTQSQGLVCTEMMFHADIPPLDDLSRKSWISLASIFKLNRIVLPDQIVHNFNCSESNVGSLWQNYLHKSGYILPICYIEELSHLLRFTVRKLEEVDVRYEAIYGTAIGAIKFAGILPWERDEDFFFDAHNYTAFKNLEAYFKENGLQLIEDKPYNMHVGCSYHDPCASLEVHSRHWRMAFTGLFTLESYSQYPEVLPTRVPIDGMWIVANTNPIATLIKEQYYGNDFYAHCEHPWNRIHDNSTHECPTGGEFLPCERPGDHNCLDNYATMGNLQFRDN